MVQLLHLYMTTRKQQQQQQQQQNHSFDYAELCQQSNVSAL